MARYWSKISIWRPRWRWPVRISPKFLASENWSPWAIVWRCLRDLRFRQLCRSPTCDSRPYVRQTVRRTHDVAYGRGSVLLWRRCDTLRTSGFVDDIMFSL